MNHLHQSQNRISRAALHTRRGFIVICLTLLVCFNQTFAQSGKAKNQTNANPTSSSATTPVAPLPLLTRRTTRRDSRRLSFGSSVALYGAPMGSVTIEAWTRPEIEIEADIEMRASSEADLDELARVNNFFLDAESPNNLRILTVGTHDRKYMQRIKKSAGKDFPKQLLNAEWKIDYRLRVPAFVDLEINSGKGKISINGTEGAIHLTAMEGDASFKLSGGDVTATIGKGNVVLVTTARSWRGRGVNIKVGAGTLELQLPANFNAQINAEVLRLGNIEKTYAGLAAPDDAPSTSTVTPTALPINSNLRNLRARAGAGGANISLTIGDGILRIVPFEAKQ